MNRMNLKYFMSAGLVFFIYGSAMAYYGNQSTEAMLTFETTADVLWDSSAAPAAPMAPAPKASAGHFTRTHKSTLDPKKDFATRGMPTKAELNAEGPKHDKAIDLVEGQIEHLMGTFQSKSFVSKPSTKNKTGFGYAGVLGEQQNYTDTDSKYK